MREAENAGTEEKIYGGSVYQPLGQKPFSNIVPAHSSDDSTSIPCSHVHAYRPYTYTRHELRDRGNPDASCSLQSKDRKLKLKLRHRLNIYFINEMDLFHELVKIFHVENQYEELLSLISYKFLLHNITSRYVCVIFKR